MAHGPPASESDANFWKINFCSPLKIYWIELLVGDGAQKSDISASYSKSF